MELKADFARWTIEFFADECERVFGGRVAVLPNAAVLKHCLRLGAFSGGDARLTVEHDGELGTVYRIAVCGGSQLVGIDADDGATVEYAGERDLSADLAAGKYGAP